MSLLAADAVIYTHIRGAFEMWMYHRGEATWTVDQAGLVIMERLYEFCADKPPQLFLGIPLKVNR